MSSSPNHLPVVLIVDSDHDFCAIVSVKLRETFTIVTADNLTDANRRPEDCHPSLMFLRKSMVEVLSRTGT
jgi:hypothetical protein